MDWKYKILWIGIPFQESAFDRAILGMLRMGYIIGKDLHIYPFKYYLYDDSDFNECYGLKLQNYSLFEEAYQRLESHYFDIIFISGTYSIEYLKTAYEMLFNKIGDVPVVLFNTCPLPIDQILDRWIGNFNILTSFSTDKYKCSSGYPISYSELPERMWKSKKEIDTFWAGTDQEPRRKFINKLINHGCENIYNRCILGMNEYYSMLRKSFVNFSIGAWNHNIHRLYESSAQGTCTLIKDFRDKLDVRNLYRDGKSAIFFSDEDDMINKLDYLLRNKDLALEIGNKGFEHIMNYHLITDSAKYLMSIIEKELNRS